MRRREKRKARKRKKRKKKEEKKKIKVCCLGIKCILLSKGFSMNFSMEIVAPLSRVLEEIT